MLKLLFLAVLTGCSDSKTSGVVGPGSTKGNLTPAENNFAGPDREIPLPLNAHALSATTVENATSYVWEKLRGGTAIMSGATTQTLGLQHLWADVYTFRVTAKDSQGSVLATDEVNLTVHGFPAAPPKTITLPYYGPGTILWFPDATSLGAGPCDTILIQPGSYDQIWIGDVQRPGVSGAPGCPIQIKNGNGVVAVNAFRIYNSRFIRVSGTGSSDLYGIKTGYLGVSNGITDVEIDHIEAAHGSHGIQLKPYPFDADNAGISEHPQWVIKNVSIHDNYIHDTQFEGMYIGNTDPFANSGQNPRAPARIQNLKIFANTLENLGADGIQVSTGTVNTEVFDNTITNYALSDNGVHNIGLLFGGVTTGKVYNNRVEKGNGAGAAIMGFGAVEFYGNHLIDVAQTLQHNYTDGIYINATQNDPTYPLLKVNVHDNVIRTNTFNGQAIRNANYGGITLPGQIRNNLICNSSGKPLEQLIHSGAGDEVSGNVLNPPGGCN